jgi:putative ABC transport system permease protein
MLLIELVYHNVLRRKARSALTIAGIAVAVAATSGLLSIAWRYAASAHEYYDSRGVDIVVVRAGVAERITSSLRSDAANQLRGLSGVADVDGSLTEVVSLGGSGLIGIPLHGCDPGGFAISGLTIQSGRMLQADDRGVILLGAGLAESLHKQAGQSLEVEGTEFYVVGIFAGATAIEANSLLAPLADVQQLMDRPDQVSEFQLRVAPTFQSNDQIRRLCQRIEALQNEQQQPCGFKAQPTRDFVNSDTETRLAGAMAYGTSAIAVGLAILGMLNTMLMSVFERTRELGILRAIGWPKKRVVKLILGESLLLALCGAACGLAVAAVLVRLLGTWPATQALVDRSLSPSAALCGLLLAVVASLIGSLYPAYRGASIPCTEALHYE